MDPELLRTLSGFGGLPPWLAQLLAQEDGADLSPYTSEDTTEEMEPDESEAGAYSGGSSAVPAARAGIARSTRVSAMPLMQEPSVATPPFFRGRVPGVIPTSGASGVPMARPGLRGAIPDAVSDSLAGASQPNIALGGPQDIIRAAAGAMANAGGRKEQQRGAALQQSQLDRQARLDEENRRKTEAEIRMYGAHQKAYESLADQREIEHKNDKEIDAQFAKDNMPWVTPDADGKYWVPNAVFNTLVKPTKPPPVEHRGEVPVTPEYAKEKYPGLLPDENGKFWVPSTVYRQGEADPRTQPPLVHGSQVDENGQGTAFWIDADGQKHVVDLGHVGKPARPVSPGPGERPATRNQYRQVEKTKGDRLAAIDKETDKRIKAEAYAIPGDETTYDPTKASQIYAEAAERKNEAQRQYLQEIAALNPDFDPTQGQQTIATPPAAAAPAQPAPRPTQSVPGRAAAAPVPAPAAPTVPQARAQPVKPPQQTVTMAQVVAASKRTGRTVDQVKAAMKQHNITILP